MLPRPRARSGKAFTAAAILRLEAEGKLSLDGPVEKWLPGAVNVNGYDGHKVTIRHLLNNTAGLFSTGLAPETMDNYATRATLEKHRFDVWTTSELLELGLPQPPIAEPGNASSTPTASTTSPARSWRRPPA
ncbi:serine hydrolase [Amycolatopsis magusensis]|uniref:serine hydrolase n=1 Tax=Amycolatopsis magusensis TaxID=882444 RepID=UPI0037A48219